MERFADQKTRKPEDHRAEEQRRPAFLTMHTGEIRKARDRANEGKAFYFVEAGIRKAIWRMNRREMKEWEQWATFSESNIDVAYVDSIKTLTSIRNAAGKTDTITVGVAID